MLGERITAAQMGGAVARRPFQFGEERVKIGRMFTADEVRGIPYANLSALRSKGFLDVHRASDMAATLRSFPAADEVEVYECVVVNRGGGKYDVIRGVVINGAPLAKAAAEKLAEEQEAADLLAAEPEPEAAENDDAGDTGEEGE